MCKDRSCFSLRIINKTNIKKNEIQNKNLKIHKNIMYLYILRWENAIPWVLSWPIKTKDNCWYCAIFLSLLKGVSITFVVYNFPSVLIDMKNIISVMIWDLSLSPPLNYWVMLWNKDESSSFWEVKRDRFLIDQSGAGWSNVFLVNQN